VRERLQQTQLVHCSIASPQQNGEAMLLFYMAPQYNASPLDCGVISNFETIIIILDTLHCVMFPLIVISALTISGHSVRNAFKTKSHFKKS
jgi:hypothetical protein